MTDAHELGPLISEHRENTNATGSTLLVGFVCFGLAMLLLLLAVKEREVLVNCVLFSLAALLAAAGGVLCVRHYRRNRRGFVRIYEHGLTVERGGESHTARWDEIEAVSEDVEKICVKDKHLSNRYTYTLTKPGGESLVLDHMVTRIDLAGAIIKEKTYERLHPQIKDKLRAGESVLFDVLHLDRDGIDGVPWSEVADVVVRDGVLEVKDRRGATIVKGAYGATPNAHLLVALIKEHLVQETETI